MCHSHSHAANRNALHASGVSQTFAQSTQTHISLYMQTVSHTHPCTANRNALHAGSATDIREGHKERHDMKRACMTHARTANRNALLADSVECTFAHNQQKRIPCRECVHRNVGNAPFKVFACFGKPTLHWSLTLNGGIPTLRSGICRHAPAEQEGVLESQRIGRSEGKD